MQTKFSTPVFCLILLSSIYLINLLVSIFDHSVILLIPTINRLSNF